MNIIDVLMIIDWLYSNMSIVQTQYIAAEYAYLINYHSFTYLINYRFIYVARNIYYVK